MLHNPVPNKLPFPLTYVNPSTGIKKKGGAYEAIGQLGTYYGLAAGDLIAALRWSSTDYAMLITGFGVRLSCPVAFTTPQFIGVMSYKAFGLTTDATGGTDIGSIFGTPRRTTMGASKIAGVRAATAAPASPGHTPLTHGTRTGLSNVIFGQSAYSGAAANINDPGIYLDLPIANDKPLFIEANEGFEMQNAIALPAAATNGLLSIQLILDWLEVPTEIIRDYFSDF